MPTSGHSNRGLDFIEKHPLASAGALLTAGAALGIALVITAGSGTTPAAQIVKQTPNGAAAGASRTVLVLGTSSGGQVGYVDEKGNGAMSGAWKIGGALTIDGGTPIGSGSIATSPFSGTFEADTLSGAQISFREIEVVLTSSGTSITTGSGDGIFNVPPSMTGYVLSNAWATVYTAGTTGTMALHVSNKTKDSQKMFSTALTVDSAEPSSLTAAAGVAINPTTRVVSGFDVLSIDTSTVHTTPAKGVVVGLRFVKP